MHPVQKSPGCEFNFFIARCAVDNRTDINRDVKMPMNGIQLKMLSHSDNNRAGRLKFSKGVAESTDHRDVRR